MLRKIRQSKFLPILIRREVRPFAPCPGGAFWSGMKIGNAICVVSLDKFHLLIIVPKKKKKNLGIHLKSYYIQIFNILTLRKFYFYNTAF